MPSLVLIGPAVRPAIGNIQINRNNAFYYVGLLNMSYGKGNVDVNLLSAPK